MTDEPLPQDGLVAVVKRDCPTCRLVVPALGEIADAVPLVVFTQDDPAFPSQVPDVRSDVTLVSSHRLRIETVPTLLRLRDGAEVVRAEGWDRQAWAEVSGLSLVGRGLPDQQPGCGALNVGPGMPERLAVECGEVALASRSVTVTALDDPVETAFDRGWTDGLPIVPPTDVRIVRMLAGTTRRADDVIGWIPPSMAPCTVEKIAINAVMAGCRPDYLPVVLAAVEAALQPMFSLHGLLSTRYLSGPVVVVNGPVARRIGMNWAGNALGQGNRANATIGRALQLVVRNIGGGRPGEVDRAVHGSPGKYTFCFAEDETDPRWQPLSVSRGLPAGASAVTLFHGDGGSAFADVHSRTAEELTQALAGALWGVTNPAWPNTMSGGALLVLSPAHFKLFAADGWDRSRIESELLAAMRRPAADVLSPPGPLEPLHEADTHVAKFHPESFLLARAGGHGGSASTIIGGWRAQRDPTQVQPVTMEITS